MNNLHLKKPSPSTHRSHTNPDDVPVSNSKRLAGQTPTLGSRQKHAEQHRHGPPKKLKTTIHHNSPEKHRASELNQGDGGHGAGADAFDNI